MRKQIITLGAFIALTLAFVQAAEANQSFVATGYSASIEKLVTGENFNVETAEIRGGRILVDTDSQMVELTVEKDTPTCAGDLICTPKLNHKLSLKLPIVKVEQEQCGVVAYTAEQDTASGRQIIAVRDNSNYNCRNFMMLPRTSVSVVKESRSGTSSALFAAGLLEETH